MSLLLSLNVEDSNPFVTRRASGELWKCPGKWLTSAESHFLTAFQKDLLTSPWVPKVASSSPLDSEAHVESYSLYSPQNHYIFFSLAVKGGLFIKKYRNP